MSETAPKSESTYSATSSEAAASEGRSDGSVTRKKTAARPAPRLRARLLRRRVVAAQPRRREQEDVRVGRERQREQRSPVPRDLGKRLHAERLEQLLEQAARRERSEQGERGDEARDHERERRGEPPEPAAREVGPHHEPRERNADRERGQRRPQRRGAAVSTTSSTRRVERDERARVRVRGRGAEREVDERKRRRGADERRGGNEQERCASARRRDRGRRAGAAPGRAHLTKPTSSRSRTAFWRSAASRPRRTSAP